MKILVLGAGAVGTYFGAALSLAGHEVTFAVRDMKRTKIAEDGIRLIGPRGDFHAREVRGTDDPTSVEDIDVALSCVKLYDAESAARQWQAPLARAGAVISLQNGIDGVERTLAGAPSSRVFGGLAFVSGRMDYPGMVHYLSDMSSLVYGGVSNATLNAFTDALNDPSNPLSVKGVLVEDVAVAQWSKFLALATNAALTCLVRAGAGVIYHDPDLLVVAKQSIDEIYRVGRAEGVALQPDQIDIALKNLQSLPATMVASMNHDLTAGRSLELDGLSGTVRRLGRKHSIATPFHDFAYACLKPYLHGAPNGPETK
ncbi:2-dehydropantoate 2-reductase [Paraburkholderia aspalathi]|uniref:2-dehydropantoate 2-reductase n=1 Tax=Paraburkholderia aspalathi TaxID=1324617 RepID=A0ABM8T9C6_9BURK|nr:ketopantoate reductase family protein [Paraburkholderia aspalathi]MBK3824192.1 ketopantoate reductase family protein [Paraburkholderia aspalathi]MBK3836032.1 ketopantoate reductase family protein [Paraburkholderia aspalathi]MBK3865822.1 ketopantoate reductase family protein [Paraburkholderia aspalathi]CAE6867460.1 2-dehydropantoate 2-reductase [Paraburkholderia aspalathi]